MKFERTKVMNFENAIHGFTLMVRCKCGWIAHIRCVNRATAIKEVQKIHCCPNCQDNDLTFIMKKGQLKIEELKEAIKYGGKINEIQNT